MMKKGENGQQLVLGDMNIEKTVEETRQLVKMAGYSRDSPSGNEREYRGRVRVWAR